MANIISDDIDFNLYSRETEAKTLVRPASAWHEDLISQLHTKVKEKAVYLPWTKTRDNFAYRRGEVTLYPGANGNGKTLMLGQISLSVMGCVFRRS